MSSYDRVFFMKLWLRFLYEKCASVYGVVDKSSYAQFHELSKKKPGKKGIKSV